MTPTLPPEVVRRKLEALTHYWRDEHERWCEDCLAIRNQEGIPVSFQSFPGPQKLAQVIRRQQKAGKPVRIIYLKPRRAFISAAIATHIFKHTAFWSGRHAAVIAHKLDSAKEIFEYYQGFQRWYRPPGANFGAMVELPRLAKSGQGANSMEWVSDQWIKVFAGTKDIGRGIGLHALHISEAAYIRNLRGVALGLLNTMGNQAETMAFKESTANGAVGEFYEDWQDASNPKSGSDWEAVFLGWNEHPRNSMPIEIPPDEFERSLSGEEKSLRQHYGLSHDQLFWRRWTIVNKCGRSVRSFNQEYPICPEDAFLTSGSPRFSHVSLARMPIIRDPIIGSLSEVDVGTRKQIRFDPKNPGEGDLLLYRKPEIGKIYVIGADNMSGKDPNFTPGEAETDPDWCSATVLDSTTGEQVCKSRGRWTAAYFADIVWLLGKWFSWAYLVPEANNHGQALIDNLLRLNYPLDRIHVRRRDPGDRRPPMLHEIGFETNQTTRPQLVAALDDAINTMSIIIRDANTLAECRRFVIWPDGTPRAAAGKGNHDDDVISLALANIGLRYAPRLSRDRLQEKTVIESRKANQVVRYGPWANGRRKVLEED